MSIQNERFTVIFNSRGSNVLFPDTTAADTNLKQVIYNVNWLSILPTKYKKIQCNFVFKSDKFESAFTDDAVIDIFNHIGFINMNVGRTNIYDGLQMSNNIGSITPVVTIVTGSNDLYYCSTTNDNNDFWIDYPTNNQITITFNKLNNTQLQYMAQYCLYLTLTGILDNEIDKSN